MPRCIEHFSGRSIDASSFLPEVSVQESSVLLLCHSAQVGTFSWAAPEVLLGRPCTEKVDIYSFGVVLWELSAGEAPPGRHLRPLRCASKTYPSPAGPALLFAAHHDKVLNF